jgi:hypothetical protein
MVSVPVRRAVGAPVNVTWQARTPALCSGTDRGVRQGRELS